MGDRNATAPINTAVDGAHEQAWDDLEAKKNVPVLKAAPEEPAPTPPRRNRRGSSGKKGKSEKTEKATVIATPAQIREILDLKGVLESKIEEVDEKLLELNKRGLPGFRNLFMKGGAWADKINRIEEVLPEVEAALEAIENPVSKEEFVKTRDRFFERLDTIDQGIADLQKDEGASSSKFESIFRRHMVAAGVAQA